MRHLFRLLVVALALTAAGCGGDGGDSSDNTAGGAKSTPLSVFGAYATQIEEPWDGVIHAALNAETEAGRIDYSFTDDIGYAGDMERVLRETAEQDAPDIIFGDAFGNEEAVRARGCGLPRHRLRLRIGRRSGGAELLGLRQLDPRAGLPGRDDRRRRHDSRTCSAWSAGTRCRR